MLHPVLRGTVNHTLPLRMGVDHPISVLRMRIAILDHTAIRLRVVVDCPIVWRVGVDCQITLREWVLTAQLH